MDIKHTKYKLAETNYNLAHQQLTIRDFDAQGPCEHAKSMNTSYVEQLMICYILFPILGV